MYCCPLWFNSTSSTIKKLKTSYNNALRYLFLIKKPYSASTMFVAHGIPSFYELLRTSIYRFADCVSKNSNSIIMACMHDSYCLYSLSHSAMVEISVMLISTILLCDILLLLLFLYMFNNFFICIWTVCLQ